MPAINHGTDLAIEAGVAVITLDFPPVNAMSPDMMDGLYDAFHQALADDAANAILLICAGRTFIAGADLKSLGKSEPKVDFFQLQDTIENSPKPTVAALHGTALGGGMETALTFHYRIAAPSAKMGLPEVTLGLLPGGGGTQRLPRIIGAEHALDLLLSGRHIGAAEALEIGLVDRLAQGDLRPEAIAFARELAQAGTPPRRIGDLEDKVAADRAEAGLFARLRSTHAAQLRHLDAPQAIVACVEAAVAGPWEAGLAVERAEFQKVLKGPQSAALRHGFMAQRAAQKVLGMTPEVTALPVNTVGVIGAGATALARALLGAGYRVVLIEADQAALDRAVAAIGATARGELSPASSLDALADADLVIEAGGEDLAARQALFARLGAVVRADAILATSSLPLDLRVPGPERTLGLHVPAPGEGVRLIEVMRGAQTDLRTLATVLALAKKLGKVAVVSGGGAGAIGERMLAVRQREAEALVREGVPAARIDRVLHDFGFPATPSPAADADTSPSSDEAILDRLLLPVIEEGARLLEDGIAARGSDIDVAWTCGYGWPAQTGGPMFHADAIGLATVIERLERIRGHAATPLLRRLAAEGGSLAGYAAS